MSGTIATSQPTWDLDTALRHVGPRGRYQLGVYSLYALMYATLAFHFISFVFIVDTPAYHCKLPPNATKNETIPQVKKDGQWVDDRCNMYVNYSYSNETTPCTDGYTFDPHSGYIATAVTDFELTCKKNILVEIAMMVSSGCMAVFQVFTNKLADTVGRKPVFLWGAILRGLAGVAKGFSPNMTVFIVLDATMQIAMTGFASMLLLMCIELFPAEYRSMAATSMEFAWFSSMMLTSLLVYLFRDWRVLQIIMHAPLFLAAAYYWLIPESLPWLMSKGKYKEAQKILEKAGRINKRPIPKEFFNNNNDDQESLTQNTHKALADNDSMSSGTLIESKKRESIISATSLSKKRESIISATSLTNRFSWHGSGPVWVRMAQSVEDIPEEASTAEETASPATIMDVLKSRKLVLYSLTLFLAWFTNSIVYSALNLTVTYLSGDRYLNFFLLSLAELPAIVSFHIALNRFGRRIPLCIFHIICGIALLLTLVEVFGVESPAFIIAMNFVGKYGITASYCSILVYSPEIYPTSVRSVFFGMCMFWALTANLIAPYCRPIERNVPGLVRGTCGSMSILVGLLVLLLPETFRRPLPKTVADVEAWTRTVSKQEIKAFKEKQNLSKNDNNKDV